MFDETIMFMVIGTRHDAIRSTQAMESFMTDTNAQTETAAAVVYLLGYTGTEIRVILNDADGPKMFEETFPDVKPITDAAGIAASDIPLEAIVSAYNRMSAKKVRGFKDRKTGAKELDEVISQVALSKLNPAPVEGDQLANSLKPKKAPKAAKEKAGANEGRHSPLAGKYWSRSGTALVGRRLGGSGVGIKALQHIIDNPGCTTDDYLANSGGGRYVDLQYDLDKGNIVILTGTSPEERAAEIKALADQREGAEAAANKAAEEAAKVKAEKEAKKLKDKEEAEAAKAKAKADKEAKKAAEKAEAEEKAQAKKDAEMAAAANAAN
jgi:hypothetical protein